MRHIIISTFLIGISSSLIAKGLDELSDEAAAKDQKAPPSEKAMPATKEEPAAPSNVAPPEGGTEAAPEAVPTANPAAPPSAIPLSPEKEPLVRSATSKKLDQRLALGTSFGWAKVKPATGTWEGLGASDVTMSWRTSKKADGNLFVTARYAPYAGTWKLDNRYYNATAHGLFVGPQWRLSSVESAVAIKAGIELGYFLVYSSAQDGQEVDGAAKAGKANFGAHSEFEWTFLEKVHAGPFLRVNSGGFNIAQFGGAVSFVF